MSQFVAAPSWLTLDWISGILHTQVSSVAVSEVTGGMIARTVRLRLDYVDTAPDFPRSLVVKLPANQEMPRMLAKAAGLYTREVLFYQGLASTVGMRVPRCYFARVADDGEDFVLVLEDITGATVHDQGVTCPKVDVLQAVRQLAVLHSSHWNDTGLTSLEWLNSLSDQRLADWEQLFRYAWRDFVEREEVVLAPDLLTLGEQLFTAGFGEWVGGFSGPQTLVHADFHTDNLLFRTNEDGHREVVTVDWQLATYASPLIDVAYFLGRMPTADRRTIERDMVSAYCDALTTGYPWDRCWEDYQRWAWYGVVSALIAVLGTPLTPEDAAAYCEKKVIRYLKQVADHDSARFIS